MNTSTESPGNSGTVPTEVADTSREAYWRDDLKTSDEPDRAQAYTLEAVISAALVIGALYVATQSAALTPLSASNTDHQIQYQERMHATDLLDTTRDTGSMREALLHWDPEQETFIGSPPQQAHYIAPNQNVRFGSLLHGVFIERQVALNVDISWLSDGSVQTVRHINMGTPSDNSVSATQTITLFNSDTVNYTTENGTKKKATLEEISNDDELGFYTDEAQDSEYIYRVIKIRLTVWRI